MTSTKLGEGETPKKKPGKLKPKKSILSRNLNGSSVQLIGEMRYYYGGMGCGVERACRSAMLFE